MQRSDATEASHGHNLIDLMDARVGERLTLVRQQGASSFLGGDLEAVEAYTEMARRLARIADSFSLLAVEARDLGIDLSLTALDFSSQHDPEKVGQRRMPDQTEQVEDAGEKFSESVPQPSDAEVPVTDEAEASISNSDDLEAEAVSKTKAPPPTSSKRSAQKLEPVLTGAALGQMRQAFFDAAMPFYGGELTAIDVARLRAAVCIGRALLKDDRTESEREVVWAEIGRLQRHHNAAAAGIFFGFDRGRNCELEDWSEAAEAYGCLARSIESFDVYRASGASAPLAERKAAFAAIAAAATLVHRVLCERGLQQFDSLQTEFTDTLKAEARKQGWHDIPCWRLEANGGPTTAEVKRSASDMDRSLAELQQLKVVRPRTDTLKALHALLAAPHDEGDFEDSLVERTLACLAAGFPPSNNEITSALLPYRAVLTDASEPKLRRLIEAIGNREAIAAKKGVVKVAEERQPDEETARRIEELRALLRGKVALFVGGGNKGDKGRREAIREALGLSELVWPDCEPSTTLARFEAEAARADLVCKVVMHARTGYKEVVKKAKADGKMGAYITKGVGLNMVAHELHEQLVGRN